METKLHQVQSRLREAIKYGQKEKVNAGLIAWLSQIMNDIEDIITQQAKAKGE